MAVQPSSSFRNGIKPVWCPGCGDFAVLDTLAATLATFGRKSSEVAVVSGIGCSSRLPNYLSCTAFNSIHGRALPIACGLKYARPEMLVVAISGDGDGFAIGRRHIGPAVARGLNLTWIVLDNGIYGLTKGQASPTTPQGYVTPATPTGKHESAVNPLLLMLDTGCPWIAQGSSADPKVLANLITEALEFPGFSFLNVLSPCPVFRGGMSTYQELRSRSQRCTHNTADLREARNAAGTTEFIVQGVVYRREGMQHSPRSVSL